jgi:hypothetical protein
MSIYVPISRALTRLSGSFLTFRDSLDPDSRAASQIDLDEFVASVNAFVLAIDDLTARGADAFVTTQLEDALVSLTTFLRRSLKADKPRVSVVQEFKFYGLGASVETEVEGRSARWAHQIGGVSLRTLGVGASYRVGKVLEAPFTSQEFERRMVDELPQIKTLVKEVTLGANAGPS